MLKFLLTVAPALLVALAAGPAVARNGGGDNTVICRATSTVSDKDQLRERLKRCKANDVLVVPVLTSSVPLTEIAGRVCDLRYQILLEPTTAIVDTGRITCIFTGLIRDRDR